MSRYIDADWIIQKLERWRGQLSETYGENDEYVLCLGEVLMKLDDAPTADVVEVVRCKDCKYSSPNKVYGCRFEPFDTSENGERMYSDDFCSYGERADK